MLSCSSADENNEHVYTVPTVSSCQSNESTLSISETPKQILELKNVDAARTSSKEPSYSLTFILKLLKVIRASIKDDPAASIDWENVRLSMQKDETNPVEISSSECRNLWRKMAYGEKCTEGDSDEESFFDFPLKVLDCKAKDLSRSEPFSLTAQLKAEKRLIYEAKKIKFLLPDKIYDGEALLVAPTFSSSNAHCLSRDLQLPLRSLSWTPLQRNPEYLQMKRRKMSESNDSAVLGTMGLFAELAAGRSSAAARWTQGHVRSTPLYKSKTVRGSSSSNNNDTSGEAASNPVPPQTVPAQNAIQSTDTISTDRNNAK